MSGGHGEFLKLNRLREIFGSITKSVKTIYL